MQCHAADQWRNAGCSIQPVTQDAVSQLSQVGADLVRIACMRSGFNQRALMETFQNREICTGGFSPLQVDHRAVLAITILAQREVSRVRIPIRSDGQQRVIDLIDLAFSKLVVQVAVGCSATCQHQDTAGISVEAVHQPQAPIVRFQDRRQMGQVDGRSRRSTIAYPPACRSQAGNHPRTGSGSHSSRSLYTRHQLVFDCL